MSTDIPLPIVWRFDATWPCSVKTAPIVRGDEVVALCGPQLVGLAASTGKSRWKVELPDGGNGVILISAGDVIVTSVIRRPQRLASILGVTRRGVTWRTDLSLVLIADNVTLVGDELWIYGRGHTGTTKLHVLEAATGKVIRVAESSNAPTMFRLGDDDTLYAARMETANVPALVRVRAGKREVLRVSQPGIWAIKRDGDTVITVARSSPDDPRSVEARDATTLAIRWTAPAMSDTVAVGGGRVVFVEGTEERPIATMRELMTGRRVWSGDSLPEPSAWMMILGPVVVFVASNATFYASDGTFLGDAEGDFALEGTFANGRVYLGVDASVICAKQAP